MGRITTMWLCIYFNHSRPYFLQSTSLYRSSCSSSQWEGEMSRSLRVPASLKSPVPVSPTLSLSSLLPWRHFLPSLGRASSSCKYLQNLLNFLVCQCLVWHMKRSPNHIADHKSLPSTNIGQSSCAHSIQKCTNGFKVNSRLWHLICCKVSDTLFSHRFIFCPGVRRKARTKTLNIVVIFTPHLLLLGCALTCTSAAGLAKHSSGFSWELLGPRCCFSTTYDISHIHLCETVKSFPLWPTVWRMLKPLVLSKDRCTSLCVEEINLALSVNWAKFKRLHACFKMSRKITHDLYCLLLALFLYCSTTWTMSTSC